MNSDFHRREFLRFVAASPLLAAVPGFSQDALLKDPAAALNVMDFEPAAKAALPPAHWGYLTSGVDDDRTVRANREAYLKLKLRPRRLTDVSKIDTRVTLFGTEWPSPIFICPTGNQQAFHPQAELAVARAAASRKHLMILSTQTNTPIEKIAEAIGGPFWYQLYTTSRWEYTEKLVRHAEAAGCPAIALTVDSSPGRNLETSARFKQLDSRTCSACHQPGPAYYQRKHMYDGLDMTGVTTNTETMDWNFVRKLRAFTKVKLILKGIETREDAALCRGHGIDGMVVSNHGGRAEESGRGTLECLPEVIDGAGGLPVLIDGGVRRGSDVFKALALGAKAVGVGRPCLWGLSAFGQPGVERVLDLVRGEFSLIMKQCGTRSIAEIDKAFVTT